LLKVQEEMKASKETTGVLRQTYDRKLQKQDDEHEQELVDG